jgi:phosphatidylglycerol lysyltransferase
MPSEPAPPQYVANPSSMDAATLALLERLAFQYGRQYDSYLATDTAGKEYFWCSGQRGVVCLIRLGRRIAVFGGILAPEELWETLAAELREHCRRHGLRLGFFGVELRHRALLERLGFQVTKVGEDVIVDLAGRTWTGKKFEWLRRQSNFCQRSGLVVEERVRERLSGEEWAGLMDEMEEINRQFLQDRPHNQGLRNVVSRFERQLIFRQRIFVARSTHRIEAFVVCTPCLGGSSWALECYRQRKDAPRGAVPFAMHQALRQLQQAGDAAASLCMVPLLNCKEPLAGDSALVRRTVSFFYDHFSGLYDSKGLYHFKSRFRPRFEDRWVCVEGAADIGWIAFLLYALGLHRVHPVLALKSIFRQFNKKEDRENLADPDQRSDKATAP